MIFVNSVGKKMHTLPSCGLISPSKSHDRGGGEKKRRVFPRKAEFGASVASSFVQPATPHPPDGEGLGPLWFAPKNDGDMSTRENWELWKETSQKAGVLKWSLFGINSEF